MYTFHANDRGIGNLAKGHPSLWCGHRLHEPSCQWLNEHVVPNSVSPRTWENKAQALITWLEWCEAIDLDWRDASRDDLVAYRDAYTRHISPHTGRRYSTGTIATRLGAIIDFMQWAAAKGWMTDPSLSDDIRVSKPGRTPISGDALAHIRKGNVTSTKSKNIIPKNRDDKVRVLSENELSALLKWAGPRASERGIDSPGMARDRLIIDLGWAVGLRCSEKVWLNIYPFEALTPDPELLAHHKIQVLGKGNKLRTVDVPAWLAIDIQAYIAGERKRSLKRRGKNVREPHLLLNAEASTNRVGYAMQAPGIRAMIMRACNGAGLIEQRQFENPETGEKGVRAVAKFSDHPLRHTYAVMTWQFMQASGKSEADTWKYIQHQLGHESLQTTMDIYLKHVNVWASPGKASAIKGLF